MDALIDRLLDLQRQHTQLHQLRLKARSANVAVAAKQRLVATQQAKLDKLLERRKRARVAADAKELEVKTLQAKIDKLREQLNSSKMNNREYQALQNEIKFAEIERRRAEDEELTSMEEIEQLAVQIQDAQAALKRAQDELAEVEARTAAEAEALAADIRKAERDRSDIAAALPADAFAAFERLTGKHEEGAMCPMIRDEDGGHFSCGGCHMRLTENVYIKLIGDKNAIVTCPNCSRILYLEP